MKEYGQPTPPHVNLKNISGFKIFLACGTSDMIVSPSDYTKLYIEMLQYGNRVEMKEYPHGHLGLLIPASNADTVTRDIIFKI